MTRSLLLAAAIALLPAIALAQPQIPATYFGSASIDGQPVPDGTEVLAFIDGKDCTQLGPSYRGTVRDGDAAAYVVTVMHESQEPGCGREGVTVTFTIGGRPANETATWKSGPTRLDLNAGSGTPPPLPTLTPTPTPDPAVVAATATAAARFTPGTPGTPPTDPIELPFTPGPGGAAAGGQDPTSTVDRGAPPGDEGGGSAWGAIVLVFVVLALAGGAGGFLLSRRRATTPTPPAGAA